jgi:hypothetical protein
MRVRILKYRVESFELSLHTGLTKHTCRYLYYMKITV